MIRARPWSWTVALAVLVVLGALARFWVTRKVVTPWIMIDELIYSDLARSVANGDGFHLRGATIGVRSTYPLLISPAWLVGSTSTAYALVKAVNVALWCAAALLVFVWARRLVAAPYALAGAALVLAMPSFTYAGMIMTENAFFPAFLLAAFMLARALERPTLANQALALAAVALAGSVRIQALVFGLIIPTAVVVKLVLDARAPSDRGTPRLGLGAIRAWWPTAAVLLALGVGYVTLKAAQGASLASGLGAYRDVARSGYSLHTASRWVVLHFAELPFSVGLIPVSAFVILLGLALRGVARTTEAERALLAVTTAAVLWVVVEVGVFASRFSLRIEERYMFVLAPLLFLAFLVWLDRGLPRPPRLTAVAALVPAALLLTLPLERLLNISIYSDTFGFIPLLRLSGILSGGLSDVWTALGAGSLAAGLLLVLAPGGGRGAILLLTAVAGFLALSAYSVNGTVRDYAKQVRALAGGGSQSWIDGKIGTDGNAAFLFGTSSNPQPAGTILWQTEFWNRSLRRIYNLGGAREPGSLPEGVERVDPATGGVVSANGGAPLPAPYLVLDGNTRVQGKLVAARGPLVLYRVRPPLRLASKTEGVYPDGWMGPTAAYTNYESAASGPRQFVVHLAWRAFGEPATPRTVAIRVGPVGADGLIQPDRVFTRAVVARERRATSVMVPLPRSSYRVEVSVEPVYSPASFGQGDTRQLGALVEFVPPRPAS